MRSAPKNLQDREGNTSPRDNTKLTKKLMFFKKTIVDGQLLKSIDVVLILVQL